MENFKENLKAISEFLAQRSKLGELAKNTRTSLSTVYDTFKVDTFDQLTGKKLDVYRLAIQMVQEIKSLPEKANDVLNN